MKLTEQEHELKHLDLFCGSSEFLNFTNNSCVYTAHTGALLKNENQLVCAALVLCHTLSKNVIFMCNSNETSYIH